jgi:phenylacetate-CoA ligase
VNLRTLMIGKLNRDYEAASLRNKARPLGPTDLASTQFAAIQRAWQDVTADIPYYMGLVREGIVPAVLSSWDDFHRIPPLRRRLLQDQPELFTRVSRSSSDYCITAGSTGTPLKMRMDQAERDVMRIVKMAEWQRFGYRLDSRLFLIWGHSHLLGTGWRGQVKHIRRKVADAFMGYKRVDAYRMAPADCRRYADKLIRCRPLGVLGYASALDMFASHVAARRDAIRKSGVRFVMATAEPLPRADSHALLADTFGCPVVQEYGGVEFGQVAFKIDHASFDVYGDLNYVEALPAPTDAAGDRPLLITSLYSRYLPLFRYDVGDACQDPEIFPHGHVRSFRMLAGRVNDQIVLSDGAAVHSVAIFHCIHQEPLVLNIQMQISDSGVDVLLVHKTSAEANGSRDLATDRIRDRLTQVHPALGNARITWADDLGTNRAGKRRWFVDNRTNATPPRNGVTHARP